MSFRLFFLRNLVTLKNLWYILVSLTLVISQVYMAAKEALKIHVF